MSEDRTLDGLTETYRLVARRMMRLSELQQSAAVRELTDAERAELIELQQELIEGGEPKPGPES